MIQAYLPSNTDYEHNGDMTLFPSSASVHAILNGSWEAELVHPIDQEGRWKFIQQEGVVSMPSFYENSTTLPQMQLFRIKSIDKSDTEIVATMEPIFYDAMDDCFLTDVRPTDKNGQQALDILCAVNTKYSGKSNIRRTSTAYYQYKNLLEALNGDNDNSFVSRWGGEMLFNDYEVIINDRVGIDAGYELRYGKNMPVNGLTESVDIRDVVTRIYPKAYNGREMSNHGYVDSELIDSYPTVKAVTMTFDNVKLAEDANADDEENGIIICDTQEELDQALTEQCEEQFASGVDKPKVTISANLVILKYTEQYKEYSMLEDVSLGDTIHCINSRLGIETSARVIELEYDSLRKKVKSVVIGDYQYNYFDNVTSSADKIEQIVLPNGNINAAVVQGIINAANAQFKIQNTAAQKVEQRAILFEDLDPDSSLFGALSIGTQGIQIAHERTADGRDWDWGTAINYRMINADYIIAGTITDQKASNFWNLNTGEFRLSATSTVGGEPIATQNNTIASVDVEYAVGDSDATAPTTGWSTASPQWQAGKYIWQRTVTTMQDGTQNTSEPTCIQGAAGQNGADGTDGKDGQDGAQGEQGVGVESVVDQYYLSNSPTEPSGGFWSETQPAWKLGFYIWTRSVVTYTDGNTEETEPILAQAINSANQSANDANQAVTELDNELDQQGVFNRLTNNGQTQGIYLSGGKLYINATYIATGRISSTDGKVYFDLNTGTLVASEIVGTEEGSTTNGKIGVLTYSGGETAEGFSVATTSGNGGRVSLLISRGVGDYTLANDAEIITTGNMMLRSNTIATNPGGNNSLIFQGNSSSGQGLIQLRRGKPGGQDNVLYASASTTNLYGLNSQLALFSNSNSTALCFNGNQAINIAQSQIDIRYSGSYVYIVSASNNYVRVGHWSGDASVIMRNNMIDFSVTGYLRASINSDGSASFGTIYSNGNVVTSERSKKKDILPLDDGAIEKIKASSVYKYSLQEEEIKDEESDSTRRTAIRSKANEDYIGIMYDEAPEELRKENVKGQKGIDLYSMVSLLWKAVQELNDKIERIKSES